ncbi:MAG: polysaccharide deacetylase [Lachnospiraceae bacterium]|nr:polysaccharide deacetylase [Lachnospiraceae bacterium]
MNKQLRFYLISFLIVLCVGAIITACYLMRVNDRMEAYDRELSFLTENVRITEDTLRLAVLTEADLRIDLEDPFGLALEPRITGDLMKAAAGPDPKYLAAHYGASGKGESPDGAALPEEMTEAVSNGSQAVPGSFSGEGTGFDEAAFLAELSESSEESGPYDDEVTRIYLTFDDGPSTYTDDILDILAEYDVKATFFVVGKTDEDSLAMYRRIAEEGHTLGMHSYSHKYSTIYKSLDAFEEDFTALETLLEDAAGVSPQIYRFPGGSGNSVSGLDMRLFAAYLKGKGISYVDWNVSAGDADGGTVSRRQIVSNVMGGLEGKSTAVVLMHDAGDKYSTVLALPEIIEQILDRSDTVLLPLDPEDVPDIRQRSPE